MTNTENDTKDSIEKDIDELLNYLGYGNLYTKPSKAQAIQAITAIVEKDYEKVDRFEVIDETGRAYVKGSIYGTPVKIDLSLQDSGRTLKVFVKELQKGVK